MPDDSANAAWLWRTFVQVSREVTTSRSTDVLITGIGNVGKSTLRRRISAAMGNRVVTVDRDDESEDPPIGENQILVVESVHGLDEPPERWGLVLYLLPPAWHIWRWLMRGLAWWRTGRVDRPARSVRRPWSIRNLPLIARLVARNIWMARQWVREDMQRVNVLESGRVVVTANADDALQEASRFVESCVREGCMGEAKMCTEDILTGWVAQSFWLDLAYDEEDWELVKRVPTFARRDVTKELPSYARDHGSPDRKEGSPEAWCDHFLTLKAIRIRDGLEFDEKRKDYADNHAVNGEREFRVLQDTARRRSENLDSITWRCGAAVDALRRQFDKEAQEQAKRTVATLIALFHAEMCAAATPDVSFGLAWRFDATVPMEAVGYEYFAWIARHNVARGQSHLGKALDAVRTLDEKVDGFDNFIDKLPKEERSPLDAELLRRALYFPAVRTLAQALEDLQRHAERQYYLRYAEMLAPEGCYWHNLLTLDLALAEADTGNLRSTFLDPSWPRALEIARKARAERLRQDKDWTNWQDVNNWLLRWQASEPSGLYRALRSTTEGLAEWIDDAEKDTENRPSERLDRDKTARTASADIKREAAEALLALRGDLAIWGLKKLAHPDSCDRNLDERDRRSIWLTGVSILEIARKVENGALKDWARALSAFLCEDDFVHFRSEAEMVSHITDGPCSAIHIREGCRANPSGEGDSPTPCSAHRYGCTYGSLHPKDVSKSGGSAESKSSDTSLASLDYYFSVMAAQQARFLNYLECRTARMRSFAPGERARRAPDFELISLRRWNSFSPNLTSRATASTGGGYLIRAWSEKSKRHVGIIVDPGYGLLENLFNEGFTIPDIDVVVLTHAHPDHTENLTNLFTLLREREKRTENSRKGEHQNERGQPRRHRIVLAMTEGVFERFQSHLRSESEQIRDIVVLASPDRRKGSKASRCALDIWIDERYACQAALHDLAEETEVVATIGARRAWHADGTHHDSMGVVVSRHGVSVGIVGDSRYHSELHEDYDYCSVIVAHLGGVLDERQYRGFHEAAPGHELGDWVAHLHRPSSCEEPHAECARTTLYELLRKKNHLYLPGVTRLICDLREDGSKDSFPLMVLSEFGEELRGGLRADLTRRLSECLPHRDGYLHPLPVIPADVGLRINVEPDRQTIFCCVCHRYVEFPNIRTMTVLPDGSFVS